MKDHLELFAGVDGVHDLRRQQQQQQRDEEMQRETLQQTGR
jgi:hypothetical protein